MNDYTPLCPQLKYCPKCKNKKSIDAFAKDRSCKDGHHGHCKECGKEYSQKNSVRLRETSVAWRQNNRDKSVAYIRKWQAENPDKVAVHEKRKYEKVKQKLANDPVAAEKERKRQAEYSVRWKKENPDKNRVNEEKRRKRIIGAGENHTRKQWLELCLRYQNKCLACGSTKNICADHIVPLSKGGSDCIDNIQPLCRSCNSRKGVKTIDYRVAYIGQVEG